MNVIEQCRHAVADEQRLKEGIAAADAAPLMLSLVHLTGETSWLDEAVSHITGGWQFQQSLPESLSQRVRVALLAAIWAIAEGTRVPAKPDKELLSRMMNTSVGQAVPADYEPIFYEETQIEGTDPKRVEWRTSITADDLGQHRALIIGAGFSGIAMAIKMAEAGIAYTIIEKNREVGGTWFENTYPGVAVDTPNHFYSYSFAPNTTWSRYFSRGSEIHKYIMECADRYGVREHIRFEEEVLSAEYVEESGTWSVNTRTAGGATHNHNSRFLITAVGALNKPAIPRISGLDAFEGPVFHTARWDHNVDLSGKRVALVGTGASGIQVAPAVAPIVDKLTIFQRSPHWIISHPLYHVDIDRSVQWAMEYVPFYMKWIRFQLFWAASDGFHPTLKMDPDWAHKDISLNAANHKLRQELIAYYESKVGHRPDLFAKVVPKYPPFGKRMLRDTKWFDMLLRPNVELVDEGIEHIERDAIVTSTGQRHETDVIVLATGFQAAKMLAPMHIVGRGGASLRDLWGEDNPRAYLGITVPGFPNFFMMYGPNTNLAHGGSAVYHSECQVRYIMQAIRELVETQSKSIECRMDPFENYNRKVDDAHRQMVWSHAGVTSWYKNKLGRVIMNSPWRLAEYRHLTALLDPADYDFSRHSVP